MTVGDMEISDDKKLWKTLGSLETGIGRLR
jgi:hypothetical protein